jgi:hypothetical protein
MNLQQLVGLALQASILLTVFGFGLEASLADISYLMRRPALLVCLLPAPSSPCTSSCRLPPWRW